MLITVGIPMNEPYQNVATASRADGTELPLPEIVKNDRLVSEHPYETLQGSCERDDSRMTLVRNKASVCNVKHANASHDCGHLSPTNG